MGRAMTGATMAVTRWDIEVDVPPSVNNLYRNVPGKGRVVTDDYAAWRDAAALQAGPWPWYGEDTRNRYRWEVSIAAHHLPHSRDLDNLVKPLLDLIARQTGLRDNYCEAIYAFRSAVAASMEEGPARVTVVVTVWDWTR